MRNGEMAKNLFSGEHQVPGQHACHARYLLLFMHDVVPRHVGLEVEGNLPGHPGEDGKEVGGVSLSLQHMHQRLNKPAACCCVPPAVEARNSAVDYQKVSMVGNPAIRFFEFLDEEAPPQNIHKINKIFCQIRLTTSTVTNL